MELIIQGKAYVLGENIDTDQIIPAHHLVYNLDDPKERQMYGRYSLSGVPAEEAGLPHGNIPFIQNNQDPSEFSILITGKNFGCGSSREHAPVALQMAGVKAIIAPSYARIFYRNAVDGGFLVPLESVENLSGIIRTNDIVEINLETNQIYHEVTHSQYALQSLGEAAEIIQAGGIFNYARQRQILM
ncbi:3-isopropylmalate dehydratase [bacterium]